MTETELLAAIENEERQVISANTSLLTEQRREALQYYYAEPYGNEVEGRSAIVTSEVKDAVEGIMPSLMAIFTSSDEVVRFEPQNPDDDAKAQQATDYVNYIFSRVNNGFSALYCLFKDALLLKNGYLKVYWEDYEDSGQETYEDLNDIEFATLLNDPELTVVKHEEEDDESYPGMKVHDVTFKRTKKYGKVCIDPVPPEEVLISRDTPNDLTKARFVEHRTLKTLSEIRQMGFKVEDDIADSTPNTTFNLERVERLKFDQVVNYNDDTATQDPSSRRVWLCEAYIKIDYNDDGIAELRKVTKVGQTVLDNEEFDSLPIIGGTAILMPHKHYGLSVHDLVKDLQLISSTVWRQLLDNAYNQNNQQLEVLDGMVNMDDLLVSRPGGIKRVKAIGSIKPIVAPLIGPPFYELLDRIGQIKQNRLGVMDFANQVDPDALNAKAHTAEIVRNAAAERINLMARILAETAVKDLFNKIFELVCKHQNKPQVVKLRGRWIPVDPRDWKNKFDTTVTVGLGTGTQGMTLQGAMGIMQVQTAMLQAGLKDRTVTEMNIFHAAKKFAKGTFPKDADLFFTDPTTMGPPAPPPPDPKIAVAQIQSEAQKTIAGAQMAAEERTQAEKKAFDAQKTQYREMMAQMAQTRDLAAQSHQAMLDREHEGAQKIVELLSKLKENSDAAKNEKESIALKEVLSHFSTIQEQQQAHHHALIEKVVEAQLAPRETEVTARDGKGKVAKTRTKVVK